MSEPIGCNISIHLPATWGTDTEKPAIVLLFENALLRGGLIEPEPVPGTVGRVHWEIDGEGNYGLSDSEVEEGLDWLLEHKVPFIATDDTKYDLRGRIMHFDGVRQYDGRYDGDVVLCWEDYEAIGRRTHTMYSTVDDYFTRLTRPLSDITIGHLPTTPPPIIEEG